MKLVSFFVLSLAVHAGALVYPVTFLRQSQVDLFQVTLLPIEQESLGENDNGGSGDPVPQAGTKRVTRIPPNVQPSVQSKPPSDSEPQITAVAAPTKVSDSGIALARATANSDESHETATSGLTSMGAQNPATGLGGTGIGNGASGWAGTGSGSGDGEGPSGTGIALTQARYRETPRPDYPESARRDGREGRVLLRVLVDDQGRSKKVEINSSSGDNALDRAAAEAIKRWRFHPARYGDRPIASWLRIPIEFRLADAKSW